jgi:hypothetical protein
MSVPRTLLEHNCVRPAMPLRSISVRREFLERPRIGLAGTNAGPNHSLLILGYSEGYRSLAEQGQPSSGLISATHVDALGCRPMNVIDVASVLPRKR